MNNGGDILRHKNENITKNNQNQTPKVMPTPNQKENNDKINNKNNKISGIYQTPEIKSKNRAMTDNIFSLNINQRNSNEIEEINAKDIKNEKKDSKLTNNDNNFINYENKNNLFSKNENQTKVSKLNFNKESDYTKENEKKI